MRENINNKINTKTFYNNEIPGDWDVKSLEEIGELKNGINKEKDDFGFGFPMVNLMDVFGISKVYKNNLELSLVNANERDLKEYSLQKGDVLFIRSSVKPEGVGLTTVICDNLENTTYSGFIIRFRDNGHLDLNFKAYCFFEEGFRKRLLNKSTISANTNINQVALKSLLLPLPPLPEQKAIAELLSTWDDAITKTQSLIAQKEQSKKWLMQNLLTGKKRIKSFVKSGQKHKTSLGALPVDWRLSFLKNVLTTKRKSFTPDLSKMYQQIGIRSHAKGLFYKEKITGASLGDKSVFWIERNCFIVNIVFAWEHAIAKTTEKEIGMIASHRFPMFKPKEKVLDLDFLLYYFKSLRGKHLLGLASPGGAGRNKTLGQSEFLKLQIPIPSFAEQLAISNLLQSADTELHLLKNKMEKLKEQKKGFMQVLLTGKKRLKIKIEKECS